MRNVTCEETKYSSIETPIERQTVMTSDDFIALGSQTSTTIWFHLFIHDYELMIPTEKNVWQVEQSQ